MGMRVGLSRPFAVGTGQAPPFPANARLPSVIFLSVPVSQGASATFECLTADAQTVPCPWL